MVTSTRSPALERLLAQHREEAQRLRVKLGDPQESLGRIVRGSLSQESLEQAFHELTHGGSVWNDDEPNER